MKFYECEHCGNIIEYVNASGVPVMCCGQKMKEIVPGTSDGAHEKHVPVVTIDGDKVVDGNGVVVEVVVEDIEGVEFSLLEVLGVVTKEVILLELVEIKEELFPPIEISKEQLASKIDNPSKTIFFFIIYTS